MKFFLLLIGSMGMIAAQKCKELPVQTTDRSPLVQLETRGCRGFCPTYQLLFHNDGLVAYEGRRNMVKMGLDSVQLTPTELKRLQSAVKELNLWQYPAQFESNVADAPPSLLTVFNGEKKHEVLGDFQRPKPILDFEAMLKDLAEAHGLKVKEGVDPYQAPPNQKEIVVKFKPSVNPGNFFMKFEEIRIRIVRRLSAENEWLIGYNPDQVSEKKLIDLLKGMDDVLDAGPKK